MALELLNIHNQATPMRRQFGDDVVLMLFVFFTQAILLAYISLGLKTVYNTKLMLRCRLVAQEEGSVGKALTTKVNDLNSIPKNSTVEGENRLPSEGCPLMVGHTDTHTQCVLDDEPTIRTPPPSSTVPLPSPFQSAFSFFFKRRSIKVSFLLPGVLPSTAPPLLPLFLLISLRTQL